MWQRECHFGDYIGRRSQGKANGNGNTYRLDGVDGGDPLEGHMVGVNTKLEGRQHGGDLRQRGLEAK